MKNNSISVVIPAYEPDIKLTKTIEDLLQYPFDEIIVINDGSSESQKSIFDRITNFNRCTVIHHSENMGKGKALKTAFSYFLRKGETGAGVVTADADGQHHPKDIYKIAEQLQESPDDLVLGVRNFQEENIPLRSRFGNKLTKSVLKIISGMKVTDTQTGLRGIPASFAKELLDLEGDRYEFEMKMILACRSNNRKIKEVTIETIYIDDNDSSHFNPVLDSIKIYYIFFRFLFSSGASFLLDIGLFALFSSMLKTIMPNTFIITSTILARILSSIFNYYVNRKVVFKSKQANSPSMIKYYILALFQMGASALLVFAIYQPIGSNEVIIKIAVDSLLFVFSFFVQKKWVFNISGKFTPKGAEKSDH